MGVLRRIAVATLLATIGVAVLSVAPASAQTSGAATKITCGMEVTTSIVVTNDLSCASVPLLTISGTGITVDLNGHRITGGGRGALCGDPRFGRCALEVREGVTLTNGRLSNVQLGIFGGTVSRIDAKNGSPVALRGGSFVDGRLSDGRLDLVGSSSVVARNKLFRSLIRLDDTQSALRDISIADNSIEDSPASANSARNAAISLTSSIVLPDDITGEIVRNKISDSAGDGIALVGSQIMFGAFRIADNDLLGNAGNGISVLSSGAPGPFVGGPITISGNLALRNGGHGHEVSTTTATVVDGGGNEARRNGTDPQCIGLVCLRAPRSAVLA